MTTLSTCLTTSFLLKAYAAFERRISFIISPLKKSAKKLICNTVNVSCQYQTIPKSTDLTIQYVIVLLSENLAIKNIAVWASGTTFFCVTHEGFTVLNSHALRDTVQYSTCCDIVNDENLYTGKKTPSLRLWLKLSYILPAKETVMSKIYIFTSAHTGWGNPK
jgi:hypothetical protein